MSHDVMGTDPIDHWNDPIFNSMTEKQNTVQPRTGLFEACIPLPRVVGNLGFGPEIDMSLFYTPLFNNAADLGDGWSFAFTMYYEPGGQLTLHSGEVIQVDKGKDLKTAAVMVRWKEGGNVLEVERKDGRIESLRQQGKSTLWAPVRLTDDGYRYVALSWDVVDWSDDFHKWYQVRLTGIRNDTPAAAGDPAAVQTEARRELVSISYEPQGVTAMVTITFWKGTDEECSYKLRIEDVALRSVTSGNPGSAGEVVLDYTDHRMCGWLLDHITSFDGLTEYVDYVEETRTFPGNPKLESLPCVGRRTIKPRDGKNDIVTTYRYSQNVDDDKAAYTTTVTEVAASGGSTTTYVYDSHYAMVSETIARGKSRVERLYSHKLAETGDVTPLELFIQREDMRSSVRTTETRFIYDGVTRTERATTSFLGSMLRSISARGVTTEFRFVAEGGFQDAYLMAESSFPGPTRLIEYEAIEGLSRKKPAYARVEFAYGCRVGQETTFFVDGYRKGQKKSVRQGVEDNQEILSIGVTSTSFDYTLDGTTMTTTTTEACGADKRSTSMTVSILSGRCLGEIDAAGNITTYAYDAQGRLSSRTTCKGTAYEETTSYAYPSVGRMEIDEPDGRKRATESDGRDNVIREEVFDGAHWKPTLLLEHDELGRKAVLTTLDVAGTVAISETCTFGYDDWGRECRRSYGDGRVEYDQFDPVFLRREEWEGKQADEHRKRTFYAPEGRIACIRWLDAAGKAWQGQSYGYDEGKLCSVVTSNDDGSERVVYVRDDYGRIVSAHSTINAKLAITATPLPITGKEGDVNPTVAWFDQELENRKGWRPGSVTAYTYRADDYVDAEPTGMTFFDSESASNLVSSALLPGDELNSMPTKADDPRRKFMYRLGAREFDAWGRATSITRTGIAETMTYEGASPVPKTVKKADGSLLNYEYIKELGYRPGKVSGSGPHAGKSKTFTYAHGTTRRSTAKEAPTELAFAHDVNERPTGEKATMSAGMVRDTGHIWSDGGRLLSETDALGGVVTYTYNTKGQRIQTRRGTDVQTDHVYGAHGQLAMEDVTCGSDKVKLEYAYDSMNRETSRTFTLPGSKKLSVTREYDSGSRVISVSLMDGTVVLGSRAYAYNVRGRLASCTTSGVWRPKNPKGKPIDKQTFAYDALGNVVKRVTHFGSFTCNSDYVYDDSGCRLSTVTHDHDDYKVGGRLTVTLAYDACGRLTKDTQGKTYEYDWLGRLARAGSRYYAYDAMDRLVACGTATEKRQLIFDGMNLRGEHGTGDAGRYFYAGSAGCSVQRVKLGGVDRTLFELCDADGTVLVTYDRTAKTFRHHAYTAYGEHSSDEAGSLLGFQGAYRDEEGANGEEPAVDRYPLGQGYRWYTPGGMQFNAPDNESPYGSGGIHAYGYCDGDPVNCQDPSGHDFWSWVKGAVQTILSPPLKILGWIEGAIGKTGTALLWGAIGVIGAVFTGGASLVLLSIAVTLAVVSAAAGVAAAMLEESAPELAGILNWISFGTGVASGISAVAAGARFIALARRGGQWMQRVAQGARDALRSTARMARGRHAGAAPKFYSGNPVIDDALGALSTPYRKSPLPAPATEQVKSRFIDTLKPYVRDSYSTVIDVVGSTLGSAGAFEDDATNSMVIAAGRTLGMYRGYREGGYDLTTSSGGRLLKSFRARRLGFR